MVSHYKPTIQPKVHEGKKGEANWFSARNGMTKIESKQVHNSAESIIEMLNPNKDMN